ncbi:hypothetical protein O0I10_008904 [Lichtheimia ornata]|uniref:Uncharacterized protein n=1 Tax=Lichtheimia ornata TaxID=688661 RepID=A0AAD7UZ83_9FUNG|nr:uncharacterized protein O0I10_008904 [Lichtheimia ornata]KAJ8655412.1 hypothetical protein O0I10_008904 [Lichtheimia ornata]
MLYPSSLFASASALLLAATAVVASPLQARDDVMTPTPGVQVMINSGQDFCLFLPPQPGLEVAPHESDGKPFCSEEGAITGAQKFPDGFITVAHYAKKENSYEQVTGFFNRDAYQLLATDGGGQYDNHASGKPTGATCKGYNYFVSMIEPDIERFCIRCCQSKADCPTGRSEYGCLRIIDGDYSKDDDGTAEHQDNSYLEEPVHSAWEALPGAVRTLEQQTADHIPQDQIKEQWNSFLNDLQASYPESADAVKDLQSATANISTEQEWKELIDALRRNIDSSSSSSSSTEGAHDNQATW